MRDHIKRIALVVAAIAVAALVGVTTPPSRSPAELAFGAEHRAAMDRMMKHMDAGHSGNVDRDFAAMMIPHHQGAIDMALAELRHGRNERLRRLAQGIVVEQQQEIAVMQAVLDEELTLSDGAVALASLCRSRPGD
jgi:uncharacterized protein (DUF305 family)